MPLGRLPGVAHQHGHRHGADAAGHGRVARGLPVGLVGAVAHQPVAGLARRVGNVVDAHVDEDDALLDAVSGDQARMAGRHDDDVGHPRMNVNVDRAGMHDSHRRSFPASLCAVPSSNEHVGEREAHQFAAAHDHHVLSFERDPASLQRLQHARRRTRQEPALKSQHRRADVRRVQPVHVLGRANGTDGHLRIDVLWERQLYNDPVNRRVGGVLVDLSRECVLRSLRFELHHRRREPHRLARLLLHLHVAFDGVVGRNADHHQVWWSLRWALLHLGSDFVQDFVSELPAINDACNV